MDLDCRVVHAARAVELPGWRDVRRYDHRGLRRSGEPRVLPAGAQGRHAVVRTEVVGELVDDLTEQPIGDSLVLRGNIGVRYTSEYNTGSEPGSAQDPGCDDTGERTRRLRRRLTRNGWSKLWALNVTRRGVLPGAVRRHVAGLVDRRTGLLKARSTASSARRGPTV